MTLEEIKTIELNVLKEVHSFCEKNNIKYYLTFGTLLGAIRHNGFIPWDDDIDIFIEREDYERFIKTFESNGCYCLSKLNFKEYPFDFAKVCDSNTIKIEPTRFHKTKKFGIDIDVFPLDYYYEPNFDKKVSKKWRFYRNLWNVSSVDYHFSNFFKRIAFVIVQFFAKPFTYYSLRRIDKILHKKSNDAPVGYITGFCVSERIRTYKLEWFENRELHSFEGGLFYIPSKYDELLSSIYGDYMKLPPEEKRVSHHDYVVEERKK